MIDCGEHHDQALALVERFYTVQGEGRHAGRAALFVRFAGCNLDCRFADGSVCDTPWRTARVKTTVGDLVDWAYRTEFLPALNEPHLRPAVQRGDARAADVLPMVVLTGGEPTMAPGFGPLVSVLQALGHYVAVETNGTRWVDALDDVDWIACSPKNAVGHDAPLDDPEPMESVLDAADEFRYVVTGPEWEPPEHRPGAIHYASPAMVADGSGTEHLGNEAPAWVDGALERALDLVRLDPRWRLSLQTHKWVGVR